MGTMALTVTECCDFFFFRIPFFFEELVFFRWGGRTHTLEVEGVKVEMGANWIHGGRSYIIG